MKRSKNKVKANNKQVNVVVDSQTKFSEMRPAKPLQEEMDDDKSYVYYMPDLAVAENTASNSAAAGDEHTITGTTSDDAPVVEDALVDESAPLTPELIRATVLYSGGKMSEQELQFLIDAVSDVNGSYSYLEEMLLSEVEDTPYTAYMAHIQGMGMNDVIDAFNQRNVDFEIEAPSLFKQYFGKDGSFKDDIVYFLDALGAGVYAVQEAGPPAQLPVSAEDWWELLYQIALVTRLGGKLSYRIGKHVALTTTINGVTRHTSQVNVRKLSEELTTELARASRLGNSI